MAAIEQIAFGKNLRPSAVDTMNKLNEVITVVNSLDSGEISAIKSDVDSLKTNVKTLQSQMTTANSSITSNTEKLGTQQEDIDKIKVTLYTPLEQNENN